MTNWVFKPNGDIEFQGEIVKFSILEQLNNNIENNNLNANQLGGQSKEYFAKSGGDTSINFKVKDAASEDDAVNKKQLDEATEGFDNLTVTSDGKVGIDNNTPLMSLQLGRVSGIAQDVNSSYLNTNATAGHDGSKYIVTGNKAVQIHSDSSNGLIAFKVADAGTAGETVTWRNAQVIRNDGRIGMGTISPGAKLHVKTEISGELIAGFFNTHSDNNVAGKEQLIGIGGPGEFTHYGVQLGTQTTRSTPNTHRSAFILKLNSGLGNQHTEQFRVEHDGKTGIGTLTPQAQLHIKSSNEIMRLESTSEANFIGFYDSLGRSAHVGHGTVSNNDFYVTNEKVGDLLLRTSSSSNTPSTVMTLKPNGNVGIDTANPEMSLQLGRVSGIAQDINSSYLNTNATYGTGNSRYIITGNKATQIHSDSSQGRITFKVAPEGVDGDLVTWTNAQTISNEGNIGIGTIVPIGKLHVYSATDVGDTANPTLNIDGSSTLDKDAVLQFRSSTNNVGFKSYATIYSNAPEQFRSNLMNRIIGDAQGGYWGVEVRNPSTGTVTSLIRATSAGNVGIGTVTPAEKLEVVGNIKAAHFAGNITTPHIYLDSATNTENASNGMMLSGTRGDDFEYDGKRIPQYGLGFRKTPNNLNKMYLSDYWGLDFFTQGYNRLSITNSGKIGIGTIAPQFKLHVEEAGETSIMSKSLQSAANLSVDGNGVHESRLIFRNSGTNRAMFRYLPTLNTVRLTDGGTAVKWGIDLTDNSMVLADSNNHHKIQLWGNSKIYGIGMHSNQTFGWLNDYATTFTMNNSSDRGWLWRHDEHTDSEGAMSLTTSGRLTTKGFITAQDGFLSGYTTRTASTNSSYWAPVAKLTIATLYQSRGGVIEFRSEGYASSTRQVSGKIHITLKQQGPMGTDPIVRFEVTDVTGMTSDDFAFVITENSATQTVGELYIKNKLAYDRYVYSVHNNISSIETFNSGTLFASLPAGVTHNPTLAMVISGSDIGIGTGAPTSKLQVVGLLEYTNNADALANGLTAGAFYRTGDLLKVVH